MSTLTFIDTHNMVFWAAAKANTVNGEHQLQALVDRKRVIITESSIRSDLHLADAGGIDCLPTTTIFEELARMGITHLFATMMVQPNQEDGVDSGIPTDHHQTPVTTQPSSSRSHKKQSRRKQRKDTVVTQEETQQDDSVPIPSNDPLLSEKAKDAQAKEIVGLKKRVQKRVESSEDKDSLGDHEDASKQGRSIEDIDKDDDVSLVDDTQGRLDDAEMFDTNEIHGDEVVVDMLVGEKQEQSAKEREVNTSVKDSAAPTTIEEITLTQTLIKIKAAKPKVVTTVATTTTTTRPKARGVVVQEPSKFKTLQESQPSKIKDKGKAIMIEPEVPLKRKDQVTLNEDLVRNLQAQLEDELIEEERLTRKKEEEANIALIESWDNTQAMMEADSELAQMLQTEEQGEITIKKRSRLFSKSYEEIQKLFDNEMRRVNTFIPMDFEVVKSKKGTEESSKGTEDELKSDKSKKAESSKEKAKGSRKKILYEHEEVEVVDEAELKKHLVIVKDDDIAIDVIPLATKPPMIVEYKLIKEGIMAHYQLIRADGSSKRYSSMIRMLQ
ncbi:hypothetical protein Tco_1250081, partial [Tanacetum coccineum]